MGCDETVLLLPHVTVQRPRWTLTTDSPLAYFVRSSKNNQEILYGDLDELECAYLSLENHIPVETRIFSLKLIQTENSMSRLLGTQVRYFSVWRQQKALYICLRILFHANGSVAIF